MPQQTKPPICDICGDDLEPPDKVVCRKCQRDIDAGDNWFLPGSEGTVAQRAIANARH